jgi:hypothetical protein
MKVEEGNVVETFKLGNTTIKICDDAYRGKTKEEINAILARIAILGRKTLQSKQCT